MLHVVFLEGQESLASSFGSFFADAYLNEGVAEALSREEHGVIRVDWQVGKDVLVDVKLFSVLAVQNLGDAVDQLLLGLSGLKHFAVMVLQVHLQ